MDSYGPDRRAGRDPYDDEGHRPQSYDDVDRPPYDDDPRMGGGPHNLSAEEDEGKRKIGENTYSYICILDSMFLGTPVESPLRVRTCDYHDNQQCRYQVPMVNSTYLL